MSETDIPVENLSPEDRVARDLTDSQRDVVDSVQAQRDGLEPDELIEVPLGVETTEVAVTDAPAEDEGEKSEGEALTGSGAPADETT